MATIKNYKEPLLEVYQELEKIQTTEKASLSAVVVGAAYDLYRYGIDEVASTTYAFESVDGVVPLSYTKLSGYNYTLDATSVKLYADNLEANLAELPMTSSTKDKQVAILSTAKQYLAIAPSASDPSKVLAPALNGMPISIGMKLHAADDQGKVRVLNVTALVGEEIAASTGAVLASPAVVTPITGMTIAGTYALSKDTSIIVQCVQAVEGKYEGTVLSITDSQGLMLSSSVTLGVTITPIALGTSGLTLTLPTYATSFALGDTYSVDCTAATTSTQYFNAVRLDGMVASVAATAAVTLTGTFTLPFSGVIETTEGANAPWSVDGDTIKIAKGMSLYVKERVTDQFVPFLDGAGTLTPSYRVQTAKQGKEVLTVITNVSDITNNFGTVAPENDIAWGLSQALLGATQNEVYGIATKGITAQDYINALKITEANDTLYSFCILSSDKDVIQSSVDFAESCSMPDNRRWRRIWAPVSSTSGGLRISADTNGSRLLCNIGSASSDAVNNVIQIADGLKFQFVSNTTTTSLSFLQYATVGDVVEIGGASYTIQSILGSQEAILSSSVPVAMTGLAFTVQKADTNQNAIKELQAIANAFNTRRLSLVWSDTTTLSDSPKYSAAYYAGLTSYVPPQQSLTRSDIPAIALPNMYTDYSKEDLNNIAASGIAIVTQDYDGKPCYMRHSLTTDITNGSMYYEEMVTRNIDSTSYAVSDALNGYIGKYNTVPIALTDIRDKITAILSAFTANVPANNAALGPQIINYYDLVVKQHPTFRDRVVVTYSADVPMPMNNIQTYSAYFAAQIVL